MAYKEKHHNLARRISAGERDGQMALPDRLIVNTDGSLTFAMDNISVFIF